MILDQTVLKYKNQVVFEKLKISPIKRFLKQYEKNEACFIFINEGAFSVRTPDQFVSFKKGQGLLAKCFDYFFELNTDQQKKSKTIEAIGVLLHPSIIEDLFMFDSSISLHTLNFNVKQVAIDALLQNFMESLNILLNNPELADEAIIKNKLKEFVILLCKTQNVNSQTDFISALFKPNLTSFKDTIINNLYSNLTMDEYAILCGMSLSSFKRKFQSVFKTTPKTYLTSKKMERASHLLLNSTLQIGEIAYDCGYESVSTFNRAFKSYFKKTPSVYKLSQNG